MIKPKYLPISEEQIPAARNTTWVTRTNASRTPLIALSRTIAYRLSTLEKIDA